MTDLGLKKEFQNGTPFFYLFLPSNIADDTALVCGKVGEEKSSGLFDSEAENLTPIFLKRSSKTELLFFIKSLRSLTY